ncbi:MAG: SDR family oxidoreductase, partial [Ignavibacteriaceae bacterium]|nr:SDR family oxidoreductase [Ignavibacteriaceae bacterium]
MADKNGIWITGASSGIGKSTALEFASVGCKVFASARRVSELERLKSEAGKSGENIFIHQCNIASSSNVEQTFKKIKAGNKIDCLVNNAGITSFKLAQENSINEIKDVINSNLLGSIFTIKSVLPHFIKNGGGTIINVLSVVVNKTFEKSTVYTASKLGLLGYTRALREEVREHNIRVINIVPGATETPIWSAEMRKDHGE